MSEHNHGNGKRQGMSRRQFLSYTLGGAGAFMSMGMMIPMLRFAVDPMLSSAGGSKFVKTNLQASDVTTTPQEVAFTIKDREDGWYKSDVKGVALVTKDDSGKLFALSPVCKHLGCTIKWAGGESPNEYYCPCHAARYEKNGKNLAVAATALDEYEVKEEGGVIYIGGLRKNTLVQ